MNIFIIQVTMFKEKAWITEDRYYYSPKDTMDFDLHPIEGKRKNIRFVGVVPMDINNKYQKWCKETKRSGSVLVGGSIREFFEYYKLNSNEGTTNP